MIVCLCVHINLVLSILISGKVRSLVRLFLHLFVHLFIHSFVRLFVCSYVTILLLSVGSKILVKYKGNSCSGLKMVPKLEEGRRGGDVASLESVTRLSFDC